LAWVIKVLYNNAGEETRKITAVARRWKKSERHRGITKGGGAEPPLKQKGPRTDQAGAKND